MLFYFAFTKTPWKIWWTVRHVNLRLGEKWFSFNSNHRFPPVNNFESLFLLFSPILSPLDELVLRELASDEVRERCERSAAPMMSSRRTSDLGEVL